MTEKIILKWYHYLNFNKSLDDAFLSLIEKVELPTENTTPDTVDFTGSEGERTAINLIYLIEGMYNEYTKRGINESLFNRMVGEIKAKIEKTYLDKGNFLLGDVSWYKPYLACRAFKIGKFYFDLRPSPADVPSKNLRRGDNIVALHIPAGEPLIYDYCVQSIEEAKAFIGRHFPDFEYQYMSCYSWLLDDSIADLLGENSNILKFATLFEIVSRHESDNIIRFVFGGGAKREDLPNITPTGRFKTRLREEALRGRVFYDRRGLIDISKIKYIIA